MINDPVPPVLHNKLPVAAVDNMEVPSQLLTTVTTGAAGTAGAALIVTVLPFETHDAAFFTVTVYVFGTRPPNTGLD
jgi:hypothetical protein